MVDDDTTGDGRPKVFLGIFEGGVDPAVAIVRDGTIIAYSEEERHLRYKHTTGIYPIRAIKYCLKAAGVEFSDLDAVAVNWNLDAYTDGTMSAFFDEIRQEWPVDDRTHQWQMSVLRMFNADNFRARHEAQWGRAFGRLKFPTIVPIPHHFCHAFQAAMQSPFDQALCLTVDGSGDQHTTVLWRKDGVTLTPIYEICIPHSLGWLYAAITEYLGFQAYDGEYKVMGLAAYGRVDEELRAKLGQIVSTAPDGVGFRVAPSFIHYGEHSFSDRFTDNLVELLGAEPRLPDEEITSWHEDVAFATQETLERAVERLVLWGVRETGIRNLCVGGGVGLNVKMNSHLFQLPQIDDVFAQPLCSDSGAAAGAALAACFQETGIRPEPLKTLALGYEETSETIEAALRIAHIQYERPSDICTAVAAELARGRVVGWFQGRMEAGPRALGQRSILADPRQLEMRDRVNGIVKFREYWRPFCPSMKAEVADNYFERSTDAPFMILALTANSRLAKEAPAVVHIDGTSRVQLVRKDVLPLYHSLLTAFEDLTGVPVLLNTSFNVKGEPIVCTIQDALRTFWATGLEILAAGDFLIRKPGLDE